MDLHPRIFICGPYTGHEEDADERFGDAQEKLTRFGYNVINPMESCKGMDQSDWGACMRTTIALLLTCTGVALLDGWESSRGANVEVDLARALDLPVAPVSAWTRGCSRSDQG